MMNDVPTVPTGIFENEIPLCREQFLSSPSANGSYREKCNGENDGLSFSGS
jgi:hypothetical protein